MTSAPEPALRASSMNALAHGADSLYTPFANPVAEMAALRGGGLIAAALDEAPRRARRRRSRPRLVALRLRDRLGRVRAAPRRLPDPGPDLWQLARRDQRRDPAGGGRLPRRAGPGALRAPRGGARDRPGRPRAAVARARRRSRRPRRRRRRPDRARRRRSRRCRAGPSSPASPGRRPASSWPSWSIAPGSA